MIAEFRNLLAAVLEHFGLLAKLLAVEARHALSLYLKAAVALAVALTSVLFGYVLLLLFVAFAAASLLKIDWIWITLGLAIFHFLEAAGATLYALKAIKKPVFTHISKEIRSDIHSLRSSSVQ